MRRSWLIGVALSLVAVAATAGTGDAAFPGTNGKLVFVPGYQQPIHIVNPDGTGLRRLHRTKVHLSCPRWSPDGRRIAYQAGFRTWMMRADGHARRRLTPNWGFGAGCPSWFPNGSIFVDGGWSNQPRVRPWSGRRWPLTPGWFRLSSGRIGMSLIRSFRSYPEHRGGHALSPDGTRVAFTDIDQQRDEIIVRVQALRAGQANAVLRTPMTRFVEQPTPRWSPDGRRLVFAWDPALTGQDLPRGYADIWVANADGTGMRRLTHGPADTARCRSSCIYGNFAPAWSPDGRQIAFFGTSGRGNGGLYVVSADGSTPRLVVGAPQALHDLSSVDWQRRP